MTFKQSPWSLKELFPALDSPELDEGFKQLDLCLAEFEKFRADLIPDISESHFMMILRELEEIARGMQRLYGFSGLSFAADTQSQTTQALNARVQQFAAEMENRTLFFSLWWKDLDEVNAQRLLKVTGDFHYFLEEMRLFRPHTLSEAEEQIVNLKNVTGSEALVTLYDAITNHYSYSLEVDGETKKLTRGQLMSYVRQANPDARAGAYRELYRVYGEQGLVLGQMYQTIVRDWHNENVRLRSYISPIAARNLSNAIPDEVVETLLDVSRKNASIFQRFFGIKARMLGMERLRRYDIYAPVSKSEKSYDFDQAVEMVLDAYTNFHAYVGEFARRVLDQGHVDSQVRRGKRDGAFCWTVEPGLTPWVLVNYQGHAEDVATLAHEMGHAVHGVLSNRHTIFTHEPTLPLAETASTFGEMILIDHLLAGEQDPSVRRDMLFRQVDDAYATILRQAYFALFENQAHAMVQQGVSVDELCVAYLENLYEQFGDSVEVADEFRWEWVSIPHIYHTPFYVYAYAFGQLLVLSLYKQYKAEGETFVPRYLHLLEAGGSDSPEHILTTAGVDMRSAAFWQGGFDVLRNLVDQLEQL